MEPTEPTSPAPMAPPPMAPPSIAATSIAAPGVRPTGVTVVTVLAGIYGALIALAAVFILLGASILGGVAGANGAGGLGGVFAGVGLVFSVIVGLVAIAYLATAYGVWRLRSWGWLLGMIVWIVSLVFGVLGLSGGISLFGIVFNIVFPGVALYYLWQPDVKRALGRS